jgi:hypothetical protein
VFVLLPETPTETGSDELHVSGTPVMTCPTESVTVAFRVVEVPEFTRKEVIEPVGSPAAATEIFCTRQVSTEIGRLLKPLAEAKICPSPGVSAVTFCSFRHFPCGLLMHPWLPSGGALNATILPEPGTICCQEKGPTEEVISTGPLNAEAS